MRRGPAGRLSVLSGRNAFASTLARGGREPRYLATSSSARSFGRSPTTATSIGESLISFSSQACEASSVSLSTCSGFRGCRRTSSSGKGADAAVRVPSDVGFLSASGSIWRIDVWNWVKAAGSIRGSVSSR